MKKVIFISSTGGHLSELMQLKEIFKNYDYHIITEKNDTNLKLKKEYGDRISYLLYGARNYMLSYMFKFPYNIIKSFFLYMLSRIFYFIYKICFKTSFFSSFLVIICLFANFWLK